MILGIKSLKKTFNFSIQTKLLLPFLGLIVALLVVLLSFVHIKFDQQITKTIKSDLEFDSELIAEFFETRVNKLKSEALTLSLDRSLLYYLANDKQTKRTGTNANSSKYLQQRSENLKSDFLAVVDAKFNYLAQLNNDNFQIFNFTRLIRRASLGKFSTDIIKVRGSFYHVVCILINDSESQLKKKAYLVAGEKLGDEFISAANSFTNGDIALIQWEPDKRPWMHGTTNKDIEQSLLAALNELETYDNLYEETKLDTVFSSSGLQLHKDGEARNTFFLISVVDHAKYDEERTSLIYILAGAFALSLIISVLVSYFLAKSLAKPISALTEGAQKIAEGHLDTQIRIPGEDEFSKLGRTFNRMATKLKIELEEKLKKAQELRRQTVELKELNSNLDKKLFESSMMLEISNSTNASMNKEKIIKSIIEIILSSFQYRQSEIFLLNESGDSVDFFLSREVTENEMGIRVFSDKQCLDLLPMQKLGDLVKTCIFQNQVVTGSMLSIQVEGKTVNGFIIIPLRAGNKVIGALQCLKSDFYESFEPEEIETLGAITSHMTLTLENLILHSISNTDSLTQINNVRYFKAQLKKAVQTSIMSGRQVAMLIGDVDHFKRFNDTYGHALGDEVLKVVASTLKSSAREFDIPARYGGEEFVMLMPDTSPEDAMVVAEMVRQNIESQRVDSAHGPLQVTMSIGVSVCPVHSEDPGELVKLADQALYASKRNGRNRSTLFESSLPKVDEGQEKDISKVTEKPKEEPDKTQAIDPTRTTKLPLESPIKREEVTVSTDKIQEHEAKADTAIMRHPVDQRRLEESLDKTVPIESQDQTKTQNLFAEDNDKTTKLPSASEENNANSQVTQATKTINQTQTIVPNLEKTEALLKPNLDDVEMPKESIHDSTTTDMSVTDLEEDAHETTEIDRDKLDLLSEQLKKEIDAGFAEASETYSTETSEDISFGNATNELDSQSDDEQLDEFTTVDDLPPVPSETMFKKMSDDDPQDGEAQKVSEKGSTEDDDDDDDPEFTVVDDSDLKAS